MVDESLKTTNPPEYRKQFLEDVLDENGMSPIAKACFMARMDQETGGFRYMYELGSPSYFTKYDGRQDLGNSQPGDGYNFRGRGYIQLTGRGNYTRYGPAVGVDLVNNPDLAADEAVAARVALTYWYNVKVQGTTLAQWAEQGNINNVILGINGGMNGAQETINKYKMYANKYGVII